MWSALLFAGQYALSAIANVEVVTLLIMVYAYAFGYWTFATLPVFVLLEGLVWGFSWWWPTYLYIWIFPALIVVLLKKAGMRYRVIYALAAGLYGLIFGFFFAIPNLFIGGPAYMFSFWVSGIPFDLVHAGANFVISLILFMPLAKVVEMLAVRTGLLQKKPDNLQNKSVSENGIEK